MILEKIFFSYSRADGSEFALKLALDLKKEGFNVWIDQEDIRAGSEWDLEIEKALETCDCLLFIETEKSVTSNNVLDEVYYALEEKKKVIPVIFVDSKTPFRLQRLQHIDFSKNYNSGLRLLINELKDTTAAESFEPREPKPFVKAPESFYKKYAGLILIAAVLVLAIAALLVYTFNNNKTPSAENNTVVNTSNAADDNNKQAATEPNETSENNKPVKGADEKKVNTEAADKKTSNTKNTNTSKPVATSGNLIERFAGDWKLVSVDPKAASTNGYLKIDAIDENKVSIKSYVQFYYLKTNDTAFLNIFNGFAGCSSCTLAEDVKLRVEDISVGSQYYRILKHAQPGEGNAGDTVMTMGSNKSISASARLQFINDNTAIIKVQQPAAIELSHGILLKPFVYSFRFTKVD